MAESITPGVLSDWALEVGAYTDGNDPATYVPVRGITEFTPPVTEKNLEDDGDFDGGAWGSQVATGISYTLEGTVKTPRGGMTVDPGQAILETASLGVLEEGFVHWRAFNKKSGVGYKGIADSSFANNGGPKTDLTTAAFTLTGRGELEPFNGSTTADATASAILAGGLLTGAKITSGGSGYATAPTVVITGPGTGATATANVENGAVVDVDITAAGTGYTTAAITFTRA